ncbi:MAG TPA: hypothetical protein VHI10_15555 [Mycobacterium sp.]|nr:hypothetical protein [Mycobacterium sp.]
MVAPYMATPTTEVPHPFGEFATATIRVADYEPAKGSGPAAMARLATPATTELTAELDGATLWLGVASDEILLAALARTIARTLGDGVVPVDVASERRSLLDAVPLVCATARQATSTEVLGGVHRALAAASESAAHGPSEVYFNYIGTLSDQSAQVQETPPGRGHALEMRVYRIGGLVHVDWWYDTSRFERYTVEELTEQFPLALYEMTSDALPPF